MFGKTEFEGDDCKVGDETRGDAFFFVSGSGSFGGHVCWMGFQCLLKRVFVKL